MLSIAICDDDKITCDFLEKNIESFQKEINEKIDIDVFYTGEELKKFINQGKIYDFFFLDIDLKTITGIDIGHYIRDRFECDSSFIIYISNNSNYALFLFKTRPLDFLIKPLDKNEIKSVFFTALRLLNISDKYFEYTLGHDHYRIQLKDIYYFESSNKKIRIVTRNQDCNTFYGKLNDIYLELSKMSNDFLYIHKSYLINYNYVERFTYDKVYMINKDILPISQSRRSKIRKAHLSIRKEKKNES